MAKYHSLRRSKCLFTIEAIVKSASITKMPSVTDPNDLASLIRQLETNVTSGNHQSSTQLLTRAKLALLHNNALVPSATTPPNLLAAAQNILELGALISLRQQDAAAFTRYFQQLQPFYSASSLQQNQQAQQESQRSKIIGLYLLLLLSQGDYAGFHTLLEGFEMGEGVDGSNQRLEDDKFIQYPIRLEQWLMEGSYDRVWDETRSERVPSEEFAIFSGVRNLPEHF